MSRDRILLAELSAALSASPFGWTVTISRKAARAIERALLRRGHLGEAFSGAVPPSAASVRPGHGPVGCEGRAPEGTSGWHRAGGRAAAGGNMPAKARQAHAPVSQSTGATPPAPVASPERLAADPPTLTDGAAVPVTIRATRGAVAFCRCNPEGTVPSWFGRDCIKAECALRGAHA